jgi:hypothetical protein
VPCLLDVTASANTFAASDRASESESWPRFFLGAPASCDLNCGQSGGSS